MFKVLGTGDDITVCDCCGRKNLKFTVALENQENGEIVRYGRDCAGAALFGSKNARNAKNAEERARMVQKCRDILPTVLNAISNNQDAKSVVRKLDSRFSVSYGVYSDTGNKMPLRIYWNGWSIPGVELSKEEY